MSARNGDRPALPETQAEDRSAQAHPRTAGARSKDTQISRRHSPCAATVGVGMNGSFLALPLSTSIRATYGPNPNCAIRPRPEHRACWYRCYDLDGRQGVSHGRRYSGDGSSGDHRKAARDETWPQIVNDVVRGELKQIYVPVDGMGKERKSSLNPYPAIPWDKLDLRQFNLVPTLMHSLLKNPGRLDHFASCRLNRDGGVLTAAISARSPDASATLFGFARMKAS